MLHNKVPWHKFSELFCYQMSCDASRAGACSSPDLRRFAVFLNYAWLCLAKAQFIEQDNMVSSDDDNELNFVGTDNRMLC